MKTIGVLAVLVSLATGAGACGGSDDSGGGASSGPGQGHHHAVGA